MESTQNSSDMYVMYSCTKRSHHKVIFQDLETTAYGNITFLHYI